MHVHAENQESGHEQCESRTRRGPRPVHAATGEVQASHVAERRARVPLVRIVARARARERRQEQVVVARRHREHVEAVVTSLDAREQSRIQSTPLVRLQLALEAHRS